MPEKQSVPVTAHRIFYSVRLHFFAVLVLPSIYVHLATTFGTDDVVPVHAKRFAVFLLTYADKERRKHTLALAVQNRLC